MLQNLSKLSSPSLEAPEILTGSDRVNTTQRSEAYFALSCYLYAGSFFENPIESIKTIATLFENSEFLFSHAFENPTKVVHEIAEIKSAADVSSDLKTLLTLDYSGTDEGHSVYGAAAYFYDLMRITLSRVRVGNQASIALSDAKYSLLARRPDLLDIRLDNEDSTSLVVPTLSMINYILARHLTKESDASLLPSAADVPRKLSYVDLMSAYETVAFKKVLDLPSQFSPYVFDLDFESQQAYLQAMGTSLYELYSDVHKIVGLDEVDTCLRHYLCLNQQTVAKLTSYQACAEFDNSLVQVRNFCNVMHISYERLGQLLHLNKSVTLARRYITSVPKNDFYHNFGPNDPIELSLDRHNQDESLSHLTHDRAACLAIIDYLAQQLEVDSDEADLIFMLLDIKLSINIDAINTLSLFKKLKNQLQIPVTGMINFFTNNTHASLYAAVMENIRPITGQTACWGLHWYLIIEYIDLLNHPDDMTSLMQQVANSRQKCESYVGYETILADIDASADDAVSRRNVLYYAAQTIAYLASISAMNIAELQLLHLNISKDRLISADEFIRLVYVFGQLKTCLQRSLKELCQLACYLEDTALSAEDEITTTKGISIIAHIFLMKDYDLHQSLQKLNDLSTLHQLALQQTWNLDDLMLVRFNVLSTPYQEQVNAIYEQQLSAPFFRDLRTQATQTENTNTETTNLNSSSELDDGAENIAALPSTVTAEYLQQQLKDEKFLANLESNVSTLFNCDPAIWHHFMLCCDDYGVSFYNTLIFESVTASDSDMENVACQSAITFAVRLVALINLFGINASAADKHLAQLNAITNELTAALDELIDQWQQVIDRPQTLSSSINKCIGRIYTLLSENLLRKDIRFNLHAANDKLKELLSLLADNTASTPVVEPVTFSRLQLAMQTINKVQKIIFDDLDLVLQVLESAINHAMSHQFCMQVSTDQLNTITSYKNSKAIQGDATATLLVSLLKEITPVSDTLLSTLLQVSPADWTSLKQSLVLSTLSLFPQTTAPSSNTVLERSLSITENKPGVVYEFLLASDNDDLFVIRKNKNLSCKIEVYVFAAASGYQVLNQRLITNFDEVGAECTFQLASNRDLFAIIKCPSYIEIHILTADSNYLCSTEHSSLAFGYLSSDQFLLSRTDDRKLYLIRKQGTGTHTTEVHILNYDYSGFDLHTGTGVAETGANVQLLLTYPNNDLLFVIKSVTGTQTTEVHCLSQSSNYQDFSNHTGTIVPYTGDESYFLCNRNKGLVHIQTSGTMSGKFEISVIAPGKDRNYQSYQIRPTCFPNLLSNAVLRLEKVTQLKAMLDFFIQDAQLVNTFLKKEDPQLIAQHLAQVLKKKDSAAYDIAVRHLEENKRDVLVRSVLQVFQADANYAALQLDTPDKLSIYLLTDVLLSGADSSSPIAQAHATLQWYLRRCVESYEQDDYGIAIETKIPDAWWAWIQQYRVWEANRQVFLFPENFLSPELRLTQSDQFQQLATTLRKSSLDTDAIAQAYLQYITDVLKLRGVKLVAACAEPMLTQLDQNIQKLHLIGCDNASPKQYYHRTVEQQLSTHNANPNRLYQFSLSPANDDLFVIRKHNNRSHKIEVYIFSQNGYKELYQHFVTNFDEVEGDTCEVQLAFNHDLFVIIKYPSYIKIYILTMSSLYRDSTEHRSLEFGYLSSDQFLLSRTDDRKLYLLRKQGTGSHTTEVHRFNHDYSGFDLQTGTGLAETDAHAPLLLTYPDNDLMVVYKSITGTQTTEVHCLSQSSNYQGFIVHTGTIVPYTGDESCFLCNRNKGLVHIQTSATASGKFEISVIAPGNYQSYQMPPVVLPRDEIKRDALNIDAFQNWTFWQKIPLNIQSDVTSIKAIFVYSRVYLYWSSASTVNTVTLTNNTSAANTAIAQNQLFCSYLHLDGSWQPAQLLQQADCDVLNPKVAKQDSRIVVDENMREFTIDLCGKYDREGSYDHNALGLYLLGYATFLVPTAWTTLLLAINSRLALCMATGQPLDTIFALDQSALSELPLDDFWGQYYWELMHFAPLTLANALQVTQQYDQACAWYKGVFNPSLRSKKISPFVFAPFTTATGNDMLSPLLNSHYLEDLHTHAFEAHRMAMLRGALSYKKYVVMQYVRNLIAWGDALFTQDTRETITEASSRYLAASELLGEAPRKLYSVIYDESRQESTLDELMTSMVAGSDGYTVASATPGHQAFIIYPYNYTVQSYFHIPENPEFMALWSDIADRLYKIRHCLDIHGMKQQLALFSPAIDPHQLVNAVAARGGEFVQDMLNTLAGKKSRYRFSFLLERAKEFSGCVERLGDNLLTMLERQDNAGLIKLHNDQAQQMLNAITSIRQSAIEQAQKDQALLIKQGESTQENINYYTQLLQNNGMLTEEISAETLYATSANMDAILQGINAAAQFAGAVPEVGSPFAMTFGGRELHHAALASMGILAASNVMVQYTAGVLARTANNKRAVDGWKLQLTLAKKEKEALTLQQAAAQLRVEVATTELNNHILSIKQQQAIAAYNNTQFTNIDLYAWLADQLYQIYGDAYQLALRVAKDAASSYQYELGITSAFATNNFWASSRKGLLAGNKLTQQLHQMQQEYLDNNVRFPEIEKVISLRSLLGANLAQAWQDKLTELVSVDSRGRAIGLTFSFAQDLFDDFADADDKDNPRLIKMLSVSIPALTGPNQQINLLLEHQGEKIYLSKGMASTGMFNPNGEDSRYLPFEGMLLNDESSWNLKLGGTPSSPELYQSISDIQIRIYYVIQKSAKVILKLSA